MHLLARRKQFGNLRSLKLKPNLVDFASNDYLGLARSPHLKRAVLIEWQSLGHLGSTGSRLLTGNHNYIEELEAQIANFHGFESGLLFNCGFMANLGLLSCITTQKDIILFDAHIHASIHMGIDVAQGQSFPFRHNDLNHLEKRLKLVPANTKAYICIESIYSTDGSIAPLTQIYQLSLKYNAHLIVDEAHAVGLFGKEGEGLVYQAGLNGKIFAQVVTFGKALGTFGAIVLGDHQLKETLVNFSQPFIYTTALPFPVLASIKCSYNLFPKLAYERAHLKELIEIVNCSQSPIQPFPMANNSTAHRVVEAIAKEGFDVRALLSPTVQRGQEKIRLTLHAFNSKQELQKLLPLLTIHE